MNYTARDLNVTTATFDDLRLCGLADNDARELLPAVLAALSAKTPDQQWDTLIRNVLQPQQPFELHEWLFWSVHFGHDTDGLTPIAWSPTSEETQEARVTEFAAAQGFSNFPDLYNWSIHERSQFWRAVVADLRLPLSDRSAKTFDAENPNGWLPPFRLNIVDACFQAEENKKAIISRNEAGKETTTTYSNLERLVNRVANGLVESGYRPGDRIAMMMPMTINAVAAYLGTIRAGCVPVAIAESFAAPEIRTRMEIAQAKAIFVADVIDRNGKQLPCYEKLRQTEYPATAIVLCNEPTAAIELSTGDKYWHKFLSTNDRASSVCGHADTEITILFSSGTTGTPKAIPWTHSTALKCYSDSAFHHNVHDKSVVAWPTSLGWMMGPWLIFASLMNRSTLALFDGAPNSRKFCEFVQDCGVTMLGVVPSLVKAWRKHAMIDSLDWSAIETFSSTGECSEPSDSLFLMSRAGYRPIIEYCGGTEIGGGYVTSSVVQPNRPSCFTTPALGTDFVLVRDGEAMDRGEVFLVGSSIGLSQTLLNADHFQVYYHDTPIIPDLPPLRRHGDELRRYTTGDFRVQGRADDAMNLGGIKISAVEIEACLNQLPNIQETAAVATIDSEGGPSQLVVFAVLDDQTALDTDWQHAMQIAVTRKLNPLFRIAAVKIIERLPRTASNKIMRRTLREMATVSDE